MTKAGLTVVTAAFRVLYVFVVMEVGTRRIVHHNVTARPTADWTLHQFREALPGEHGCRYVIHDRDLIYSKELDRAVESMGVRVVRTPVRCPKTNVSANDSCGLPAGNVWIYDPVL